MAEASSAGTTAGYGMAGVQILSGFLQAEQVKRQAKTQAEIAEFNANLAEYDAWKVNAYGATVIARSQNEIDQARGSSKVYAAARGIELEGSLEEVVKQNELNSMLNKLDMDNRTQEQAMGYKRQASSIRLGSALNGIASSAQASSLIMGGIAQGAGTAASTHIRSQGITEKDLNLPQKNPSGYSSFKPSKLDGTSNITAPHAWGVSLMPGGY